MGWVAVPLALAMAVSGLAVGTFAVSRDLAAGVGDFAYSQLTGVASAMVIFVIYVAMGIAARKKPDWHKRMMLLAPSPCSGQPGSGSGTSPSAWWCPTLSSSWRWCGTASSSATSTRRT